MTTSLLIIDPQNDFMPGGALAVDGADADMRRLAGLIDRTADRIDAVTVTLDSHQPLHIAHPPLWMDAAGGHPDPFTIISVEDVRSGRWRASDPALQDRQAAYVAALAASGRYQLMIWPQHCLIGTPGHAVQPDLFAALKRWSERRGRAIGWLQKGHNLLTEHYSAIRAEVPDLDDPHTLLNQALVEDLRPADRILVAGEASSHCVASTVRDLAAALGADATRLTLLTDCMSPVRDPGGFGVAAADAFFTDMRKAGIRLAESVTI